MSPTIRSNGYLTILRIITKSSLPFLDLCSVLRWKPHTLTCFYFHYSVFIYSPRHGLIVPPRLTFNSCSSASASVLYCMTVPPHQTTWPLFSYVLLSLYLLQKSLNDYKLYKLGREDTFCLLGVICIVIVCLFVGVPGLWNPSTKTNSLAPWSNFESISLPMCFSFSPFFT